MTAMLLNHAQDKMISDDPGAGKITVLSDLLNNDVHIVMWISRAHANNIADVGLFVSSASD